MGSCSNWSMNFCLLKVLFSPFLVWATMFGYHLNHSYMLFVFAFCLVVDTQLNIVIQGEVQKYNNSVQWLAGTVTWLHFLSWALSTSGLAQLLEPKHSSQWFATLTTRCNSLDTAALAQIFWYNVPHRCFGTTTGQATLAQMFQHNQGFDWDFRHHWFSTELHMGFKTATLIMQALACFCLTWYGVQSDCKPLYWRMACFYSP